MSEDAKPWDLLNPKAERVSDEEAKERYQACFRCPELNKFTTQCRKCGCFMKLKTTLTKARCPLGKW
jgi:hypothetical protein